MDFNLDPGPDIMEQYKEYIVNFGDTNIKVEEENERLKTDCCKNITHTTTNDSENVSNRTLDGHAGVFETDFNLETVNENASISDSNNHNSKTVKSEPADINSETYISNENVPNINAEIEQEQHEDFRCTDDIESEHADVNVNRKHTDDNFAVERVEHTETLVKEEMDIGPVELMPTDFALTMTQLKEEPAINHGNNGVVNTSNGSPSSQDRPPLRELNTKNLHQRKNIKRKTPKKPPKEKKVSFNCRLCPAKLTSLAYFNNHRMGHILEHATEKQECIECHADIESIVELKSHYNNDHPKILFTIFICDVCSKSFVLKQSLALHFRLKHAIGQRKKKVVQASKPQRERDHTDVESAVELKQHCSNVHAGIKLTIFICDVCCVSFSWKTNLARHLRATHTDEQRKKKELEASNLSLNERNGKYKCSSCPVQFTLKTNRDTHYRIYHTEARFIRYTCDVCGQAFKQKRYLKDHIINKHITPTPYHTQIYQSCPHCAKVFKNSVYMRRHVSHVHLGRKNKKCNHCGKRFISQSNFAKHVAICENELEINKERLISLKAGTTEMLGKWICEICKKSYKNQQTKRDHINRCHKNAKKLCNVCGLSLSCQSALKKHLLRAHSGSRPLTPRTLKCDICLKMYDTKKNLQAHISRLHPIGQNNCDLCNQIVKPYYLTEHKRIVHKDLLPYSCDRCSQTFRRKDRLTSHVKECFKL